MLTISFLASKQRTTDSITVDLDTELAEFYLIWFPVTNGIASEPR